MSEDRGARSPTDVDALLAALAVETEAAFRDDVLRRCAESDDHARMLRWQTGPALRRHVLVALERAGRRYPLAAVVGDDPDHRGLEPALALVRGPYDAADRARLIGFTRTADGGVYAGPRLLACLREAFAVGLHGDAELRWRAELQTEYDAARAQLGDSGAAMDAAFGDDHTWDEGETWDDPRWALHVRADALRAVLEALGGA